MRRPTKQELELARKIEEIASKPLEDLGFTLRLLDFPPALKAAVWATVAQRALKLAAQEGARTSGERAEMVAVEGLR